MCGMEFFEKEIKAKQIGLKKLGNKTRIDITKSGLISSRIIFF